MSAIRPAATILLLRDGLDGLEVFMVVRHRQIDFASGALVFPGGSVDAEDRLAGVRPCCRGAEGLDEEALAFRVAAIREAFEECGVLLAGPKGGSGLVDAERLKALDARWRAALANDTAHIGEMLEAEELELAVDCLVPFAHWITPEGMPKRFDTHFFLAEAPADHLAVHDGSESVDSVWIRPEDACAEADADKRTVIFPTRMNIEKLGRSATTAEALAAARAETVVTVQPQVEKVEGGRVMRIPEAAGYGVSEVWLEGQPGDAAHRMVRDAQGRRMSLAGALKR